MNAIQTEGQQIEVAANNEGSLGSSNMEEDLEESQPTGIDKLQEIVTERFNEEIEDDHTTLRKKYNQTPLVFYIKLGSSYVISFKKSELLEFLGKAIALLILQAMVLAFLWKVTRVSQSIKSGLTWLAGFNLLMFLLIFFVDAGTLFEDEDQQLNQERSYCQTCKLYTLESSRHCRYCVKCVQGYDHHCTFFGKCIGRRNYLMFCGFIIGFGAFGMGSMVSLVYSLFGFSA